MHCREFEDRLQAILDDRRTPQRDPRLREHAARCESCRQLLTDQAALLAGFSRRQAPQPRADFARQVVLAATAASLRRNSARKTWLAIGVALASAAAVLLAVSLALYSRQTNEPVVAQPSLRRPIAPGPRSRGFAITLPAPMQQQLSPAKLRGVTGADLILEAPGLPGRLSYRGAIDELVTALPEAGYRLEQMEYVAPGLRPLRLSLSAIWETLCRTIPGSQQESPTTKPRRTSNWWLEPIRVA
jgi:hypothetical protein